MISEILIGSIFSAFLILVIIIDYKTHTIPNRLLLYGGCVGVVMRLLNPLEAFSYSLFGMLIGFSVMFVLYLISRGQMGFGDVKFVAVCGIYLGIWPIIVAVLIGSIIGGVVAAFLLLYGKITRRQYIAYGPYLAIGAAASYVYYMLISKY